MVKEKGYQGQTFLQNETTFGTDKNKPNKKEEFGK